MPETICKTVCQYNRVPVPAEDMKKLLEIAEDYRKVKAYVYQRYGSISGLPKLYPGYEIQNEMTASGFKGETGIPSVYFYLAIFDALSDIRGRWTVTKNKIRRLAGENKTFTEEEKHYLRFLLKTDKAFAGVIIQESPSQWGLPEKILRRYDELAGQIGEDNIKHLHRYLCRQVRKYHARPQAGAADGFSLSKSVCRYGDHGIYISTKESRKRVFIPLTDGNEYKRQSYIKLYPEESRLVLRVPVKIAVHRHQEYRNHVGVRLGDYVMLITHEGHQYGERFGIYKGEIADIIMSQQLKTGAVEKKSGERKKYHARLSRAREHLKSYVNMELNRFLREEKPEEIYLPKIPLPEKVGKRKREAGSRKGYADIAECPENTYYNRYVRERLLQKCREHSVRMIKI